MREVHAGASVFIPAGTSISADNFGSDAINLVAIFPASGFEDFMREISAGDGEKRDKEQRQRRRTGAIECSAPPSHNSCHLAGTCRLRWRGLAEKLGQLAESVCLGRSRQIVAARRVP